MMLTPSDAATRFLLPATARALPVSGLRSSKYFCARCCRRRQLDAEITPAAISRRRRFQMRFAPPPMAADAYFLHAAMLQIDVATPPATPRFDKRRRRCHYEYDLRRHAAPPLDAAATS